MDDMDPLDDDQPESPDGSCDVGDWRQGKTRLLSEQCSTCIFRPGDPMHLGAARLRDFINEVRRTDSYVVCHSTLPGMGTPDTKPAICRGFTDRYDTVSLRLIRSL